MLTSVPTSPPDTLDLSEYQRPQSHLTFDWKVLKGQKGVANDVRILLMAIKVQYERCQHR
jgi:hypothetical protein